MIEGGGSKNYIHTKRMMYRDTLSWRLLLDKIVKVLEEYCRLQVQAGADVIQIFDSWVGSLGLADYREYAFDASLRLVNSVQKMGVPVIYFGVETAGLLGEMAKTGADVIGLDWRQPLDEGWRAVGHGHAVQGNLDPITLFAPLKSWNCASKRFCVPPTAAPATSSTLAMASFPPRPSKTSRPSCAWSRSSVWRSPVPKQTNDLGAPSIAHSAMGGKPQTSQHGEPSHA